MLFHVITLRNVKRTFVEFTAKVEFSNPFITVTWRDMYYIITNIMHVEKKSYLNFGLSFQNHVLNHGLNFPHTIPYTLYINVHLNTAHTNSPTLLIIPINRFKRFLPHYRRQTHILNKSKKCLLTTFIYSKIKIFDICIKKQKHNKVFSSYSKISSKFTNELHMLPNCAGSMFSPTVFVSV